MIYSTREVRRDREALRPTAAGESSSPVPASPPVAAPPQRTWRRHAARIAIVLVVVAGLRHLSHRDPFGPSAGTLEVNVVAPAVAATEPATLRIGTYNIHGGRGTDGVYDLDRIAGMLRGLDFVGLNEVHGPMPWQSEDQAATLGRTLGMTPLYVPTEDRWRCLQFGNALLTRAAVDHWQAVPLERRYGKSHRHLLHARVRAANGATVNVVCTHLDRSDDRERREQLRTAGHYFLALAAPAVLMGDLNSDVDEPALQFVLQSPEVVDVLAERLGAAAPRHIDWILVRGATVVDAGITDAGPSDHPHVWAELRIPGQER